MEQLILMSKKKKEKISDGVKEYIKHRPHIKVCLEDDILNYSATSRKINRHVRANPEAIKASLIRLGKNLRKKRKFSENKVLTILKNSSIEVKNKVAIVIAKDYLNITTLTSVEGPSAFTHMVEESRLKKLKKRGIIKIEKGLDIVTLLHPPEVEFVPGVVAFIMDVLSSENINLNHIFSCYNDTLLVVKREDTIRTFKLLTELMA